MTRQTFAILLLTVLAPLTPLWAAPLSFEAFLSGLEESPPNASPATGYAKIVIDDVAHTMSVDVTFDGLLTGNTAAHIHVINGPGDTNTLDTLGPVATTTPTFTGFPSGTTSGNYFNPFEMTLSSSYRPGWITDSGGTTTLAEAELFAGIKTGRAYLNIHSSTFPGGEIRGFLAPVPEPASLTLALLMFTGLLFFRGRARSR
jgi:hypothetical protein